MVKVMNAVNGKKMNDQHKLMTGSILISGELIEFVGTRHGAVNSTF
jgi:hypothetical protein